MELYYFLGVIVIASLLQGITGFGSALVAAPLLLLLIDKTTSVVSLTFVSIAMNLFLFLKIKYPLEKESFYRLLWPSLLGLPIGILILQNLEVGVLRIIAGTLSVVFAFFLFAKNAEVRNSKRLTVLSGWLSGVLHTSVGIGGPPIVLLLASQNTEKDEMRKTLALLFFVMSIVSIILFLFSGHLTSKSMLFGLYGIPAAFVGSYIGNYISKKVSQQQFIWSVFILITITIIIAFYSGFRDFRKSRAETSQALLLH